MPKRFLSNIHTHPSSDEHITEQLGVQFLAQGYFGMQAGAARE